MANSTALALPGTAGHSSAILRRLQSSLDAQLKTALLADAERAIHEFGNRILLRTVIIILVCSMVGLCLPQCVNLWIRKCAKHAKNWDLPRMEWLRHTLTRIVLVVMSMGLMALVIFFAIYITGTIVEDVEKVDAVMVNEMLESLVTEIFQNMEDLQETVHGIFMNMTFTNPTEAKLDLHNINGCVKTGGLCAIYVQSTNRVSIDGLSQTGVVHFRITPYEVGAVAGAVLSGITGIMTGLVYITLELRFEGKWDSRTFWTQTEFVLPLHLDTLPAPRLWFDCFRQPGADTVVKRSLLKGLEYYADNDQFILQLDSLSMGGGAFTELYLMFASFCIFIVLACSCGAGACCGERGIDLFEEMFKEKRRTFTSLRMKRQGYSPDDPTLFGNAQPHPGQPLGPYPVVCQQQQPVQQVVGWQQQQPMQQAFPNQSPYGPGNGVGYQQPPIQQSFPYQGAGYQQQYVQQGFSQPTYDEGSGQHRAITAPAGRGVTGILKGRRDTE